MKTVKPWVHVPEDRLILLDEEHPLGARITLESESCFGAANPAPVYYAITCGIYGLFFHTRFLECEADARNGFDEMKLELARILALAASETASDEETRRVLRPVTA